MDSGSASQTPAPGPPKKGFWGFIASFFPKQHPLPGSPPPSHESKDPAQHETPSGTSEHPSTSYDGQPSNQQGSGDEDLLARPAPIIKPDHDPQPLHVPENLEAEPIQADGVKVSPTLETQEPAQGDPASEDPQPMPPTQYKN